MTFIPMIEGVVNGVALTGSIPAPIPDGMPVFVDRLASGQYAVDIDPNSANSLQGFAGGIVDHESGDVYSVYLSLHRFIASRSAIETQRKPEINDVGSGIDETFSASRILQLTAPTFTMHSDPFGYGISCLLYTSPSPRDS